MRPPIPDYSETVECTDHHCVTHGHPAMQDTAPGTEHVQTGSRS